MSLTLNEIVAEAREMSEKFSQAAKLFIENNPEQPIDEIEDCIRIMDTLHDVLPNITTTIGAVSVRALMTVIKFNLVEPVMDFALQLHMQQLIEEDTIFKNAPVV